MSRRIFWVGADAEAPPVALVGGKGRGLDMLCRAGLRVPEAFVVSTDCFRDAIAGSVGAELEKLTRSITGDTDVATLDRLAAQARHVVFEGTAGHPGEDEVRQAFQRLREQTGSPDLAVAVRSSSAAEDAADASFAGEHDSYLWVRGVDDVCEQLRRCWASLFTSRACAYRARAGAGSADAMAVVVQRMVDARSAGVFMTLNPVNGDRSKIVIESLWGLGELLVSGAATPDRFTVDKVTGEILTRELAVKPDRLVYDARAGRGTRSAPVAEHDRARPSLSDAEIGQLVAMGRAIERFAGSPQDGEFAVSGEADEATVYLVQARPETVWSSRATRRVGGSTDVMSRVVSTLIANDRS